MEEQQPSKRKGSKREEGKVKKQKVDEDELEETSSHEDQSEGGSADLYAPSWDSLDKRPLPSWYDEAKFGIFIHWGVYSVPAYAPMPKINKAGETPKGTLSSGCAEWYWRRLNNPGRYGRQTRDHHNGKYGAEFKYQDFAQRFTAENWDPDAWADLFVRSGAKYVVLTSKHHEGFCNWGSEQSPDWNSVEVGPKKDIVGLLTAAVRKRGLKMGFYFSLLEWFNPVYLKDKRKPYGTQFVDTILLPQLKELVCKYLPDIIWSDGDWECPASYWKSEAFLAWLYNESPVKDHVVVNDRWGKGCAGNHGGFFNFQDRFEPTELVAHKWECCMTMAKSWGYNAQQLPGHYKSVTQLIQSMVKTIAFNGNLLLNIGPKSDGTLSELDEERLVGIGKWMSVNGEAIYGTKPCAITMESAIKIFYTQKDSVIYAISCERPISGALQLRAVQPNDGQQSKVSLLGSEDTIAHEFIGSKNDPHSVAGLKITLPSSGLPLPWTFKLEGVSCSAGLAG